MDHNSLALRARKRLCKQVYQKVLSLEEAKLVLEALTSVHGRMKKVSEPDPLKALEIAVNEGLTYYDAAYIQAAVEKGMVLVTEDKKLLEAASKYVKAVKSGQL